MPLPNPSLHFVHQPEIKKKKHIATKINGGDSSDEEFDPSYPKYAKELY